MEKQLVYTTTNDKREISVYYGKRKECIVSKKVDMFLLKIILSLKKIYNLKEENLF